MSEAETTARAAAASVPASSPVDPGDVMGFAARALKEAASEAAEKDVSLLSLNSDFIGEARQGGKLAAKTEITRRTRSVVFASAELESEGRPVLTATAVFKVLG